MKAEVEKFSVSQVPGDIWETLVGWYNTRDLIDVIRENQELHAVTRGFQIVPRNVKLFRTNLLAAMAKDELYAAPIFFDWLENDGALHGTMAEIKKMRKDESADLTVDAATVKQWLGKGVDKAALRIFMYCSDVRFTAESFGLVE